VPEVVAEVPVVVPVVVAFVPVVELLAVVDVVELLAVVVALVVVVEVAFVVDELVVVPVEVVLDGDGEGGGVAARKKFSVHTPAWMCFVRQLLLVEHTAHCIVTAAFAMMASCVVSPVLILRLKWMVVMPPTKEPPVMVKSCLVS